MKPLHSTEKSDSLAQAFVYKTAILLSLRIGAGSYFFSKLGLVILMMAIDVFLATQTSEKSQEKSITHDDKVWKGGNEEMNHHSGKHYKRKPRKWNTLPRNKTMSRFRCCCSQIYGIWVKLSSVLIMSRYDNPVGRIHAYSIHGKMWYNLKSRRTDLVHILWGIHDIISHIRNIFTCIRIIVCCPRCLWSNLNSVDKQLVLNKTYKTLTLYMYMICLIYWSRTSA